MIDWIRHRLRQVTGTPVLWARPAGVGAARLNIEKADEILSLRLFPEKPLVTQVALAARWGVSLDTLQKFEARVKERTQWRWHTYWRIAQRDHDLRRLRA